MSLTDSDIDEGPQLGIEAGETVSWKGLTVIRVGDRFFPETDWRASAQRDEWAQEIAATLRDQDQIDEHDRLALQFAQKLDNLQISIHFREAQELFGGNIGIAVDDVSNPEIRDVLSFELTYKKTLNEAFGEDAANSILEARFQFNKLFFERDGWRANVLF